MITGKTIFISPLDWGFGHAARCVPLIRRLSENNTVIIGVTPLNNFFFDQYFPGLLKVQLPSYNIRYSRWLPVWLKVLAQWQNIKGIIKEEKKALAKIVKDHNIHVVISDNRFGLYNANTENIFMTHQLNVKAPFSFGLANSINLKHIHNFSKVWVPDYNDENARLSGDLANAKNIKIPVEYIGPLSALTGIELHAAPGKNNTDLLVLLSGVEPQRSILEELLLKKFRDTTKKIVLVRGSNSGISIKNTNIHCIDFAVGSRLKELVLAADTIICRSGYSTLMDLHLLGKKKLVLIPTPGQTEQEYLAHYWQENFFSTTIEQKNILKTKAIDHSPTV